jgi:hypothetical protein
MACPYFDPAQPREDGWSERAAMLPLGGAWSGICLADPRNPRQPEETALLRLCNLGYARHACSCFPAFGGADAVRFAVARDAGDVIHLRYAVERDHHPLAHGALEYSREGCTLTGKGAGEVVCRQALAYVTSYLRRKGEALRL